MSKNYRVYFTPLMQVATYGTEVEVTDYISQAGIKSINRGIDTGDFDFGQYLFADIALTAINLDGVFNTPDDFRSMFIFSRNLTKVRLVFENSVGQTITFKGIINEESTTENAETQIINFRVLGQDSVLRTTMVGPGVITIGDTVSIAIKKIINVPAITKILTYISTNINPKIDFVIDNPEPFNNLAVKDVLDTLLLASNSIITIDSSGVIEVKSRADDPDQIPFKLYGPFVIRNAQNIDRAFNINTGKHRQFTSVKVNTVINTRDDFSEDFGFRQKSLSLNYVTNAATMDTISASLLDEFKAPKIELQLEVATDTVKSLRLLDRVTLDYPLRLEPTPGKFLPVYGITKFGQASDPYPNAFGSFKMSPQNIFKIVEIDENPDTFNTTLKLRQIGIGLSDGVAPEAVSDLYGAAIYGTSTYG